MFRSIHERMTDRLKGLLVLVAIVFAILVVAGAPGETARQEVPPPVPAATGPYHTIGDF